MLKQGFWRLHCESTVNERFPRSIYFSIVGSGEHSLENWLVLSPIFQHPPSHQATLPASPPRTQGKIVDGETRLCERKRSQNGMTTDSAILVKPTKSGQRQLVTSLVPLDQELLPLLHYSRDNSHHPVFNTKNNLQWLEHQEMVSVPIKAFDRVAHECKVHSRRLGPCQLPSHGNSAEEVYEMSPYKSVVMIKHPC